MQKKWESTIKGRAWTVFAGLEDNTVARRNGTHHWFEEDGEWKIEWAHDKQDTVWLIVHLRLEGTFRNQLNSGNNMHSDLTRCWIQQSKG
jgi:formamidopyrimidine-DNA glycosylase